MRHKENAEPHPGAFFCTRECIQLEQPSEGLWELGFQTVEVGSGYPYSAGSEKTLIEMHPPAEDGSVRCVMSGFSEVNSRVFRWWSALEPMTRSGATAMLQAIEDEMLAGKKKD